MLSFTTRLAKTAFATTVLVFSASSSFAMQVDVLVDKVSQHMRVLVDGQQQYDWLVSTGGEGYDTPSGNYHIFRMEKDHFSKEWDDAPMPYSMFFTGLGHAVHGSFHVKSLGRRASHGCVRLAPENAAILWDLVTKAGFKNNSVVIKGGFFDNGNLTTEKSFHMSPEDRTLLASASNQPKPVFWWTRTKPADSTQPDKPKQVFSLFAPRAKAVPVVKPKGAKPKVVAINVKPADKKKLKKKLVPAPVADPQG